jgi:hypothetical protein
MSDVLLNTRVIAHMQAVVFMHSINLLLKKDVFKTDDEPEFSCKSTFHCDLLELECGASFAQVLSGRRRAMRTGVSTHA